MNQSTGASPQPGGLDQNLAGLIAYITFIPALIFLLLAPYNRNPYVRFHSFQSIFFNLAMMLLSAAVGLVAAIPFLGVLTVLLWPLLSFAVVVLWVILMVKAYQGQRFRLPVIGEMAERQAAAV